MNTPSIHIDQLVPLDPSEKILIDDAFEEFVLPKGELWLREGKVCDQVAYLVSGKLRVYYTDDTGQEVTCYFVTEDNFISSLTSFLTRTPTVENIIAIEDTVLQVISKDALEELSVAVPKMQIFRRVIAENLFITMEKRINMLQSQSAYERYESLVRDNPELLLTVPLQYTASFLGITPQHLSRIRKEASK